MFKITPLAFIFELLPPLDLYIKGCNPIATMFIMDAIAKQSDRVLENREQTIDAMKNSFVHGEAWVDTAEQLQKVLGLSK